MKQEKEEHLGNDANCSGQRLLSSSFRVWAAAARFRFPCIKQGAENVSGC
jgi:hypothetical protein